MANPLEIIDRHTAEITRSLDIVVYALEGLYEMTVRDQPNIRGLQNFWMQASDIVTRSTLNTANLLSDAEEELAASLSTPERVHAESLASDTFDVEIEYSAIGAFLEQAKVAFARRVREVIAAKVYGMDTYNADPHIMTRNGRRWNFTDYAYLMIRQILVNWYNEVKIDYLASQGVEEFTLLTEDPDLFYTTYRVDEYPNIAPELFHPRTTKLVGGANVSP